MLTMCVSHAWLLEPDLKSSSFPIDLRFDVKVPCWETCWNSSVSVHIDEHKFKNNSPICVIKVQPTWDKALLRGDQYITQYCMPPHDVISSMYNFSSGEIFFYLFAGVPGVSSSNFEGKTSVMGFLIFFSVAMTTGTMLGVSWSHVSLSFMGNFPG